VATELTHLPTALAVPSAALIVGGRRLQTAGLVRARSGNVSVRLGAGLLITAAGARLGRLDEDDLLAIPALDDRPAGASSELALHAAILAARPVVGAVVHTHSPYATAHAATGTALALVLEEARYYGMGAEVPLCAHAPGGSQALADAAVAALGDAAAVLLERHGAIAVGPDLDTALDVAESLEHQAHVAWLVRTAG
jgi:L-fuculose-phosphate aldolase